MTRHSLKKNYFKGAHGLMISAPGLSLSIQDKAVDKLLSPERDPQITTGLQRMCRIEALRDEKRRVPTAGNLKEDIDERTLA